MAIREWWNNFVSAFFANSCIYVETTMCYLISLLIYQTEASECL